MSGVLYHIRHKSTIPIYMSHTKKDRNKRIVKLRDGGLSFAEIGILTGVSRQTAHEIYQRERQELSTPPLDHVSGV